MSAPSRPGDDRPAPFWQNVSELLEDDSEGAHSSSAAALPGLDVSSFQGTPAQWRGHAGRFSWCAVKLTEHYPDGSTYLNPDAAADWAFLEQQRKLRVAYVFGHPGSSAAVTASAFLAELERIGCHDADGVSLDLEVTDGRTPAQVDAWALEVTALIGRALDRPVVLYTFLSYAESGNCRSLGHLPLWIADPSSPAGRPRVPAPWKTHAIHQYAITGAIDRDVAVYLSTAQMAAHLGKRGAPPAPAPSPAARPKEDPMLLNKNSGAQTPVAIPAGSKALRFVAAAPGTAVFVQFHGHTAHQLNLSWKGGSERLEVPAGCHAALVTRSDDGTGDVSVAVE